MSDQLLGILKLALLALLYLFFARVLWAVWSEVRTPRVQRTGAGPVNPTVQAPAPRRVPVERTPAERRAPKGRRGTVARLEILDPRVRRGQTVALDREVTFGRGDGCTVTLPEDTFASQVHARVFPVDDEMWVEDLGSTNGTYLNGHQLDAAKQLRRGDRLQIGNTVFEAQ